MHRTGHVGLGLLAASPLSWAALERGDPALALAVTTTVVALSTLPDVDEVLPGVEHRTWTHSIPFAALVGLLTGFGWWVLGTSVGRADPLVLAGQGGTAGAVAVLVHLLGDVVTPMGVAVLWPVSRRRRSLKIVPSNHRIANYLLLAGGAATWVVLVGDGAGLLPAVVR
ncbi:metal-dependent hydrolase [Halobacteriales archaeon Cl-PHB]